MQLVYKFDINHSDRLCAICRVTNNLYNQALYIVRNELKDNDRWLFYPDLDRIMKNVTNLEGTINYRLVKAAVSYVKERCTNECNAKLGKPATAGYRGAATARGKASTGSNGLSVARGKNVQVKGGIGAILVIAEERDDTYDIVDWKAVVVDGEVVKADTWYRLENGELVEVD